MNFEIALVNIIFWGLVVLGTVAVVIISDHLDKKYGRDEETIPVTDDSGKVIKYISLNDFYRDCY